MPELPEVESLRRVLEPLMAGATFEGVDVRRPNLRTPFPERFAARLLGERVLEVRRRAKYLLMPLASGDTLLVHLGMSGWIRVDVTARDRPAPDRPAPDRPAPVPDAPLPDAHDHVVFRLSSGAVVTFNDPRRFGLMDLLSASALANHPALRALGPEPLSESFDAASLALACQGRKTTLKAALLDQRAVAGLGNIYASEALHRARLSPGRRASTIATPSGAPRDVARALSAAIKQVLSEAIDRRYNPGAYRSSRFRVYDREGQPCRRRGCGGVVRRRTQGGRSTFYCPVCQR